MARKHNLEEVLKSLKKKNKDIDIDSSINTIYLLNHSEANSLGNSLWGKIDYLVKVHRYVIIKVTTLPNRKEKDNIRELVLLGLKEETKLSNSFKRDKDTEKKLKKFNKLLP